ncbi:LysR substrate-binding domain-containing protein [Inquilinus sp. OTU3971]|uniref:LysR substrate-binding domain-containing protein n=1 Tax=Inquilinus sp. OTU3971 TaxID=3043855 RepID=UPI00313BE3E8
MTLEQLRIFVAVAEHLHVTRAAQALNLTQSAASAAIQALEARHATKLFHRVGRGIALTDAGTAFLPEARAVLIRAALAERALDDLSGLRRGVLALHASQTIGNYWLPSLMHRFRTAHPGLQLDLTIGNTTQVAEAVREGRADIGFVEGDLDLAGFEHASLPGDRLVLVVGAGHPWAGERMVAPARFADSPWVLRERGSGTRQVFESALGRLGVDPAALPVALELASNEAVRAAIEAGAGAGVLSSLAVESGLRFGTLHQLDPPFPARRFRVLRHPDHYRSKAVEAFLDMLDLG